MQTFRLGFRPQGFLHIGSSLLEKRHIRGLLDRSIPFDRRMTFRDMHWMHQRLRSSASPILQFYSSNPNIGNYLPVAAIQQMIGMETDTWSMHYTVDFDWVNANYRAIIVGGAGLFAKAFTPFWHAFDQHCRLPAVIWGVGVCLPDLNAPSTGVPRELVKRAAKRCDLINVRDTLTATHYGLAADVAPCPTVVYLDRFTATPQSGHVTLAQHDGLATASEHLQIANSLRQVGLDVNITDNVQRPRRGVDDIIRTYARQSVTISTRLHGAIISYGLGIPYVAVDHDAKIRAFQQEFGGGVLARAGEAASAAQEITGQYVFPDTASVHAFGRKGREWASAVM